MNVLSIVGVLTALIIIGIGYMIMNASQPAAIPAAAAEGGKHVWRENKGDGVFSSEFLLAREISCVTRKVVRL